MSAAKALYHLLVPSRIRNPFGRLRRDIVDLVSRSIDRSEPPAEILEKTSGSPFLSDFRVRTTKYGNVVLKAIEQAGIARATEARVLVVPSGAGELLRAFAATRWTIRAADIDDEVFSWTRAAVANIEFESISDGLPFHDETFDAIVCLDLPRRGLPANLPLASLWPLLRSDGILVAGIPSRGGPAAAMRQAGDGLELLCWSEQGLEAGIDLVVTRRR